MGVEIDGLEKAIRFVQGVAESVVVGTAAETASRIAERTPVDTGNARLSWHITDDPHDAGIEGKNSLDADAARIARTFSRGDREIYIVNSAEYIKYLEHGTSRTAPRAMVARTLPEVPEIANKQLEDALRQGK
jgi:hypothetical protein